METTMFVILFLLMVCHYLADFTALSTGWMLQAKQFGKPLYPILVHASVHALLMGIVLLFFVDFNVALRLFGIQLIAHFSFDTLKGRLNGRFPSLQDHAKRGYWMILGFDQFLHHATILVMVYYLIYLS